MANLRDVAQEAGVSIATVSRVLNNSGKVHPHTRARVQQAVQSLHYRPSRVARRLRAQTGRAQMLGIIIPEIQNPFFSEVVRGVEDAAYDQDYALLLCDSDEDAAKEEFYLQVMRSESVDGVILDPVHKHNKTIARLARSGLPIVCLDRSPTGVDVDTIVVDNRQGAYEAVDLLVRLGHRRIGLITGLPHHSNSEERRQGYEQALEAHGIALVEELVGVGNWKPESGRLFAARLMDLPEPPTALFASNNLMTLGALEYLRERGLRIPDDLAFIGFDDVPWANLLDPPLTVVRQPSYQMGRQAVEMLFQRINEPGRPCRRRVLKTELVIRRSCGSPSAPAGAGGHGTAE